MPQIGFNSKMVRLKAFHARFVNSILLRFNSKMVRLKVMLLTQRNQRQQSFNSKMVRLKVTQLHWSLEEVIVSIPKWYD